jgi:DNA polymerase-1
MGEKLLLIDASSNIFRAFYALPALTNRDGVPTNATLGFLNMLQKSLRESRPDFVAVVFDAPGRKRRREMYEEYKATRDAAPEDLKTQIPWVKRIVEAFHLASFEYEGEEADDVIATLALQAAEAGVEVEIASTDKDLMQLANERITLVDGMKDRRYGPAEVEERFGVPPEQLLDVRSLVGDSSDNIPGVKGIGEKGAAQLIREFGSLDALLERTSEVRQKRAREALEAHADEARLSRDLSRLRTDLPIAFEREALRVPEPDAPTLVALLTELEFKRHLEELGKSPAPAAERAAAIDIEVIADAKALKSLVGRITKSSCVGLGCVLEPDDAMTGALIGLAVSDAASRAAWIDLRTLDEQESLGMLRPLLEDAARSWVGHHLKRDAVALGHRGVRLRGTLCDAGVAAYVSDPSQQVGKPAVLVGHYLGRDAPTAEDRFGKGAKRRLADEVDAQELADFFGTETACALDLHARIEAELEERGQLGLYRDLEVPLTSVLARLELAGVRIDEERLESLSVQLGDELSRIEARIYELAGETFNIGSPKQLQQILFEKLALPPTKKTKTGFSTDESVLEDLSASYDLPAEILAYRRLSKLPTTGRIHGRFNQTVAATGRLSSSHPNLQNIPVRTPEGQEIRRAFIPAEGRLLLSADYSQIELRILAHLSADAGLVEAFREGVDIHVRTASQVFGVAPEDVTGQLRSRTKAINFGIVYGQGPFGLARQLRISQADAREHIREYFERYPGVKRFLDASKDQARERGYAETLDGRRRYLPDLHSRNRVQRSAAERMATNSVIQGTAADYIKRAMVEIDAALAGGGLEARMILQVHDELVFEVSPADLEALRELVVARMQGVAQLSVPLEVHVGSGGSWLEAH